MWQSLVILPGATVPVTIRAAAFRTRCSLLVTLFDAPTRIMLPESTRDVTVRDAYGRLSSYSVLIGVKLTASISADRRQAKCVDRMDQSQVSWLSRSVVAVDRSLSPTWMTLGSPEYLQIKSRRRGVVTRHTLCSLLFSCMSLTTRSSAVAETLRNASCHWIFC